MEERRNGKERKERRGGGRLNPHCKILCKLLILIDGCGSKIWELKRSVPSLP